MHERKDKYKYFDMKLDSAKDAFFKKRLFWYIQNFILPKNQITIHPIVL